MNNNPMFSVIIPAYNVESTVENCIESVEKQGLAEKFINFGIKLNRLPKEDKDELIQFIRKRKHITCYSNSIPDKVFCVLIHVLGVRFSCFVFDTIVKMRNSLRGG